jgi:hypothetical protein
MRIIMALLVAASLAGCLQGSEPSDVILPPVTDLLAGTPLWLDPQNTPHPQFGWPTLSSPPEGASGWWAPIPAAELPNPLTGLSHLAQVEGVSKGGGIALFGSIAVVPGYGTESSVVDISDPASPKLLSTFAPQGGAHRGAAMIAYPDGRLVTVISSGNVIDIWDLTDPTRPSPLPPISPSEGSHKLGVVPGTPIVYNAASDGGNGGLLPGPGSVSPSLGNGITAIYDLTDPQNPVHVQDFANGYGCHHVFFWQSAEKQRAICAGIEYTQIWDTADPLDPKVIVSVPVHHGVANAPSGSASILAFSHYAGLNQDGTVLIVGDEMGGGGLPPGCVGEARTPVGSASTPIGALWFYDVSDETNPIVLGYYSPLNDPRIKDLMTSCTAHHGRLVPTEGRDTLAMSFYGAGVVLLDFTNPRLPVVIDQFADNSDTWETWYYNGYLFTGDLNRGMDILALS